MNNRVSTLLVCLIVFSTFAPAISQAQETALDRYVQAQDPAYEYEKVTSISNDGVTAHAIKMTSQTWLTEAEVDKPVWWHWVNLYVPDNLKSDTALLLITGGSTRSDQPRKPDGQLAETAKATGSIVAELRMVPNQPLVFHDDGEERYEDDLIAYGWDKFLRGGKVEWLARLPMTKSAVRAMDTVTDFFSKPENGGRSVERFVVAGASKRGWTTWTTGAVDKRVVAIAPIVIDMLNVVPSFKHHWETYGFYAPAVGDYVKHGIMDWQDTPEYEKLIKIVEPYEYRDRLTIPKLMINATGDQFFLPDSHRFFFDDLTGPTYVRYVPNADHSLRDSDAAETLAAWHYAIINERTLPKFNWQVDWEHGAIRIDGADQPKKLLLWQASNKEARDFRLETIGKAWTSSEFKLDENGSLLATVSEPDKGWTAFMLEATYEIEGSPVPLKLTTGVAIVPDTLPFGGQMPKTSPK